jgi:hypothetical protein
MGTDFKNFRGAQVCITDSPSRQSQRIIKTANDKLLVPKMQEVNRVELQYVHSCLHKKGSLPLIMTGHTVLILKNSVRFTDSC